MSDRIADMLSERNIHFSENEPMSKHTSFKIGGRAKYYICPQNDSQAIECLRALRRNGVKFFPCGNLSNVVFADYGYDGAVIDMRHIAYTDIDGLSVLCGAGTSLTSVASMCADNELSGLEFAFGIPGTVGGGVYMNAGAYGGQMSDVVSFVNAYDIYNDELVCFSAERCDFSYRHSIFSDDRYVILSVGLLLGHGKKDEIRSRMNDNMKSRRDKQPLELPCAGSVFKRPEGRYVGSMIEQLGLKGYRIGGIAVSDKHAGFMVNVCGGTCSDLLSLIDYVKDKVYSAYGVELTCEIKFVM